MDYTICGLGSLYIGRLGYYLWQVDGICAMISVKRLECCTIVDRKIKGFLGRSCSCSGGLIGLVEHQILYTLKQQREHITRLFKQKTLAYFFAQSAEEFISRVLR